MRLALPDRVRQLHGDVQRGDAVDLGFRGDDAYGAKLLVARRLRERREAFIEGRAGSTDVASGAFWLASPRVVGASVAGSTLVRRVEACGRQRAVGLASRSARPRPPARAAGRARPRPASGLA